MGRIRFGAAAAALALSTMVGFGAGPAGAAGPPAVTLNGSYRIISTDCYFGAGRCSAVLDLVQSPAGLLSSPTDRHLHGRVSGRWVVVSEDEPPGVVEDGWLARGYANATGGHVHGDFLDGIGETGTFVLNRLGGGGGG
jgi:hypothetical protein